MPKRPNKPLTPRQIEAMEREVHRLRVAIKSAKEGLKDPAAVSLGRRGGLVGGKARALSLSARERSDIARAAAIARWSKD